MNHSNFYSLNWKDFFKGLIIAVLGAVIGRIAGTIEAGSLSFDWPLIGKTALRATITYISKNLLTNSKDEFLTKEKP